jgi:hypothetical protein
MNETNLDQKILAAKEASGGGEVLVIETDIIGAEVLAFRVPKLAEWKRYRAEASDPSPAVKAMAATPLVHSCCVLPTPAEFERIVEAHPGLIETCIGELVEHAGAARAKKVRKM